MEKNNKIAIIVVILIVIAGLIYIWPMMTVQIPIDTTTLGDTDTGTVVKNVYGNASANNSIALITGIHPRETLSIDP